MLVESTVSKTSNTIVLPLPLVLSLADTTPTLWGCLLGNLLAASDKVDRVVFKVNVELEKLEARLQYESGSAPPLALVSVEEVAVDLTVRPGTLNATARLGNLRAQDGILPEVGTRLLQLATCAS